MSFQAQDRSNGVFISDRGRLQQNLATRQTKLQVGNKTIVRFGPCCFISVHICPCPSAYLYISIYAFVCVDRRPQVFSLTIMEMHYIGDNRQHPVHHKQWEPTLLSQMPLYRRTPNWSLGLVSLCFNDVHHLRAFLAPRDSFQRSLYQHPLYFLRFKKMVTLCCGSHISRLRAPIEIVITPFKTRLQCRPIYVDIIFTLFAL